MGRWIDQAAADLGAAEKLADLGMHFAACFYAQQAAEKAIKGALLGLDLGAARTHSVAELAEALATRRPELAGLRAEVGLLDQFYIPTRHPDALPGGIPATLFGPEDSDRALRAGRRALAVARAVTPPAA